MAKRKKRLRKLVAAVQDIIGNEQKAKELKKAKALRRFIDRLEDTRSDIRRQLETGEEVQTDRETQEKHLMTLDKQIQKAERILKEMEEA